MNLSVTLNIRTTKIFTFSSFKTEVNSITEFQASLLPEDDFLGTIVLYRYTFL